MNAIRRHLPHPAVFWALISLTITACNGMTVTPSAPGEGALLATPALIIAPCESCDQATLAAAMTLDKNNADHQVAATAEIERINAQSTLNSANATLSAAQAQEQNIANIIAAQITATAQIVQANAQATLNSAGSTQSAALTQAQYNLQVTEAVATQRANAIMTEQNKNDLAAGTQTAIANTIATQTQIAVATSQWYADQTRQRAEQRQAPIAFLWMWCLPSFIVLFAGLVVWGFWRWLKIQQNNQRILENPIHLLSATTTEIPHHHHEDPSSYLDSNIIDGSYQLTKPDDQMDRWLDEVKSKLLGNDNKDEDDHTDN